MNILEVRNLNKTYKDFQLKDVNLTIPKGYIMGFVDKTGQEKQVPLIWLIIYVSVIRVQ